MTWIKGPNGIARWDGGAWADPKLYPEGQKPKKPRGRPRSAKHGTTSGYTRHWRDKEPACAACLEAHRNYENARLRRIKENA